MYKLILVDDEEVAINNISIAMNWEKNGFELAGKFWCAETAIEYMKENRVDVIISDIQMQNMSGLEFAEYVQRSYPDVAFVILSGYDKFEYARSALKYNVVDYILKPIILKDIEDVLAKCKEFLDKRRVDDVAGNNFEIQAFVDKYLKDKAKDISFLREKLKQHGFKNGIDEVLVVSADITFEYGVQEHLKKHYGMGIDNFNNWINNLFMDENDILLVPTAYHFDHIESIIFCDCTERDECIKKIENVRDNIKKTSMSLLGMDIELVRKKISHNVAAVFDDVRSEFISINVNMVFEQICNGETERAIETYKEFERNINRREEDICKFYASLALRIKDYDNYFLYDSDVTQHIVTDISQIKNKRLNVCDMLRAVSTEMQKPAAYDYISIAKEFINENYAKDITLADVAEHVRFSESWFSRQFKKKTGKAFVDYMNEVRIAKAVAMLKGTNNSINNIYEAVGYKSRNHFFVQFKKYMGCSPQEYRKNMKQN